VGCESVIYQVTFIWIGFLRQRELLRRRSRSLHISEGGLGAGLERLSSGVGRGRPGCGRRLGQKVVDNLGGGAKSSRFLGPCTEKIELGILI
jgi:hypothetical protein